MAIKKESKSTAKLSAPHREDIRAFLENYSVGFRRHSPENQKFILAALVAHHWWVTVQSNRGYPSFLLRCQYKVGSNYHLTLFSGSAKVLAFLKLFHYKSPKTKTQRRIDELLAKERRKHAVPGPNIGTLFEGKSKDYVAGFLAAELRERGLNFCPNCQNRIAKRPALP